jgi:hypothetical protein
MADPNPGEKSSESSVDESLIEPEPDPNEVFNLSSTEEELEPQPSTSTASPPKKRKKRRQKEEFLSINGQEVQFHQQDPWPYVNNCPLAIFFAWLELFAYSCSITFDKYKPKESDKIATTVSNTLALLLAHFKNLKDSLPTANPNEKSAYCLKLWFEMRQKINPNWSAKKLNSMINCTGDFQSMIMVPLNEVSNFLLRRWCSCAVKMRDEFRVVTFKLCKSFLLRY